MSAPVDIRPQDLAIVHAVVKAALPPNAKIYVFGSRATWTTKDSSDLDLAIDAGRRLTPKETTELAEAFDDSNLPYRVDVVDMHNVTDSFKAISDRDKVGLPRLKSALKLGDHCDKIGSGATPLGGKTAYLESGFISLVRSQNIHNDGFSFDGIAYIDQDQADKLRSVELFQNDVLVNITGDSVARVCQVHPDVLPARVNQHVAIIRPKSEEVDPIFLRYWLVTPSMQSYLLGLAAAGATRNALTKSMLEALPVPAIEISEQRAIARALSSLDDKIELNRRMNETLEGMARAIFKDWFVDFGPVRRKLAGVTDPIAIMGGLTPARAPELAALFPDGFGDDGLPEGWRVSTLANIATVNDESWKVSNHPVRVEYVDLSNTKWGVIESTVILDWADAPSRARRIARPLDTIIGTVRPGNGSYAYVSRTGYTVSTGFAVLRPSKPEYADALYVASTSEENIQRLANLADSQGGAYPAVNPDVVLATDFVFSDHKVIAEFSAFARPIREKIEQAKEENRTLSETRDYLLPKLMSGQVRVRDAEKMVEDAA